MQKKLDPIEIAALREAGFSLAPVAGQGDERYTWLHSASGARQEHTNQPARRSQAQAWRDCQDYVDGEGSAPAQPDWLDR